MYYANLFCMTLQEVSGLKFTRCSRTERNAVLSQRGTIQGLTYAFHGRGCYFQTKELVLDVDFDALRNWNGIDLWRLQHFLTENKRALKLTADELAQHMAALLYKQRLHQVDRIADQHFYYLSITPHTKLTGPL